MRVLSLKQPWATLIVRGIKRYEARSWQTPFRGQIALHASSGTFPRVFEEIDASDVLGSIVCSQGWGQSADLKPLPRMAVIGAVDIVRIVPAAQIWGQLSPEDKVLLGSAEKPPPGIFVWELANPIEIKPVPVLGQLNLWTLPEKIAAVVEDRISRPLDFKPASATAVERARKTRAARIERAAAAKKEHDRRSALPVTLAAPLASLLGVTASTQGDVRNRLERYALDLGLFVEDSDEVQVNEALRAAFDLTTDTIDFNELWDVAFEMLSFSEQDSRESEVVIEPQDGPVTQSPEDPLIVKPLKPANDEEPDEATSKKQPKAKKPASRKPTRSTKTSAAFEEPVGFTKALEAIVGKPPLPRVEIMKRVWKYIKANRLQDPKDPSIIRVQKLLIEVIPKKKTVTMFEMTKHLFRNTK